MAQDKPVEEEVKKVTKTLHTVNNYVLVEYIDKETKVGNIIVDHDKAGRDLGIPAVSKVVCTNVTNENGFEVGDDILFYRHAAEDIIVHGKKCLILTEKSIMGVYK